MYNNIESFLIDDGWTANGVSQFIGSPAPGSFTKSWRKGTGTDLLLQIAIFKETRPWSLKLGILRHLHSGAYSDIVAPVYGYNLGVCLSYLRIDVLGSFLTNGIGPTDDEKSFLVSLIESIQDSYTVFSVHDE